MTQAKIVQVLVELLRRPEARALLLAALKVAEEKYRDPNREDEVKKLLERAVGPLGAEAVAAQPGYRAIRLAVELADRELAKTGIKSVIERVRARQRLEASSSSPASEPSPSVVTRNPADPVPRDQIERLMPGWTVTFERLYDQEAAVGGLTSGVRATAVATKRFGGSEARIIGSADTPLNAWLHLVERYQVFKGMGMS